MDNLLNILESLKNKSDSYLNLIINELSKNLVFIDGEKTIRIKEELELISEGNNSEKLYKCIQLGLFFKQNREPFILAGNLSSLLVLYSVGLTKLNPLETKAKYETLLGIPHETKTFDLEFRIRESFMEEAIRKAVEINNEKYRPFYQIIDGPHSEKPYPVHISFLPIKERGEEYFELEIKDGKHFIKDWIAWRNEVPGFSITLCPSQLLNNCYEIINEKPGLSFTEGLEKMNSELLAGNYEVLGGFDEKTFIPLKQQLDINDLISLLCLIHSSYAVFRPDEMTFFDRDSVLDYFLEKGVSRTRAYHLMENIRKGMFRKESVRNIDLPQEVIEGFENVRYLWSRAAASDFVYYYLLRCINN